MKYLSQYQDFDNESILLIIDVQKSFSEFFTDNYVKQLKEYCRGFDKVYQIYDNHVEGKNPDKDYLYKENPPSPINGDLFKFPKQVDIIEKRYRYDVEIDFFKKELTSDMYKEIKSREENDDIKVGEYFETKNGTILVFINNNHNWFECPVKLFNLLKEWKNKQIVIVGGADRECLTDVEVTAKALGVKVKRNDNYIYSAQHCPIK
jgi:hypothetical protein